MNSATNPDYTFCNCGCRRVLEDDFRPQVEDPYNVLLMRYMAHAPQVLVDYSFRKSPVTPHKSFTDLAAALRE